MSILHINNKYTTEIILFNDIIRCTIYGAFGGCVKAELNNNYAIIYEIYSEKTDNILDLIYDINFDTIELLYISLNFIKSYFKAITSVKFDTILKKNPALLDSYRLSYYYISFHGKLWLNNINSVVMNNEKYENIITNLTNLGMMSWELFNEHIICDQRICNYGIIYNCYRESNTYLEFFRLLMKNVTRNELFDTLGGYSCGFLPISWYDRFMQFLTGSIVTPELCETQIIYTKDIDLCDLVIDEYDGELNKTIHGYKIL
jgi:hypothetical protein